MFKANWQNPANSTPSDVLKTPLRNVKRTTADTDAAHQSSCTGQNFDTWTHCLVSWKAALLFRWLIQDDLLARWSYNTFCFIFSLLNTLYSNQTDLYKASLKPTGLHIMVVSERTGMRVPTPREWGDRDDKLHGQNGMTCTGLCRTVSP